jgi:mono/diheme cytochrome c family protein
MLAGGIFRQEIPLRNANRPLESFDLPLFLVCPICVRRVVCRASRWATGLACREMVERGFSTPCYGWHLAWLLVLPGIALGCRRSGTGPEQATERAEQTFRTVCGRCHGADGKGGVAPEGVNAPRNFCDPTFQASRTDDQLKQAIRVGKGAMPGFGNLFSDVDLQGLVRKIRSFDPGTKKP